MKNIRKILRINKYILLFLSALALATSVYIKIKFDVSSFEQLLYTISNPEGTGMDSISGSVAIVILATIAVFVVLLLPILTYGLKTKLYLRITAKKHNIEFPISYVSRRLPYSIIVFLASIVFSLYLFDCYNYLASQMQFSNIYEDYYVEPNEVSIVFPKKKQNLIYIYVESLETTAASIVNGGNEQVSYIPKLEKLALENVNFSNSDKLGGAYQAEGTGWTVAGMIAQTSGINLKVDIDGNSYSGFSSFLGGVTNLGDILKKNGYKNYILMGSEAKFGGRNELFAQHGDYEIFDLLAARKAGKIPEDYRVWWGYEDEKLFEYAKEKVLEASKSNEPFNVTLLTADTHFVDGYREKDCSKRFDSQYADVFYCSDSMIYDFVKWIKEQSFYDDTTIVIAGDHLTMQSGFYPENGYERVTYNAFINARTKPVREKNRVFTAMDMFPTTLAALGAEMDGDRLALGTNLFSDKDTLAEEMGFDTFNDELSKRSIFYNNNLLGKSYYEIRNSNEANSGE